MSVGKKSLARVASVTAKKEQPVAEQTVETVIPAPAEAVAQISAPEEKAAEEVKAPAKRAPAKKPAPKKSAKKVDERFKNVRVGDDMPAFLL